MCPLIIVLSLSTNMRLQLHLTPNTQPVPFNHLHQLTGALHKWLGPNDIHDGLSLYSFGWLKEALIQKGGLAFPKGSRWNVSFYNVDTAKRAVQGLMDFPDVAFGMRVAEVRLLPVPDFGSQYNFRTDGSAIIARREREDKSREYLFWDNPLADSALTAVMQRKLIAAGFNGRDLEISIRFDRRYPKARTRKITIKNIEHKGSECPVVVEGTPEAVRFAWLVGIGELTGSGFGGVY
jgi:CRISPR-associated endoribonuclease Cas6